MFRRAFSSRPQRRVTDYLADVLVRQGVKNVFGGHGGAVIPLVDSISSHPGLNWVYMRNEQAASLAAAADAKLTGRLAVCVATSGPGASHLTTGLVDALQDRCPVLAITGTKATNAIDLSEFQMIHQEELFRAAGLPFSNVVMSEAAVPAMLRNAIAVALREKAAVHLALPVDIQSRMLTPPRSEVWQAEVSHLEYQASESRVQLAAKALEDPQLRIVIALGHRAAIELSPGEASSPANPYLRLAETLNAPIITQLDAKGCVDETHPLSYGVLGIFGNPGLDAPRALVNSADMVLLFGVDRQAIDLISDASFNQVRRVVEFEPDAGSAAYHRWYECDVVVLGKLASNARRLEAAVANLRAAPAAQAGYNALADTQPINEYMRHWTWLLRGGWRNTASILRARSDAATSQRDETPPEAPDDAPPTGSLPGRFQIEHGETEGYCHPGRVLEALSKRLQPEDVVCVDVGDITLWASLCLCLSGGQRVLSSQGMGTMGYALPAAIAASLERPKRNVVVIAGDGGAQMTIGELATAKQHKCQITMIIFNNHLLGRVHFGFDDVRGDEIVSPDFVALARAYGGDGVHVRCATEVEGALRAARAASGLFVLEVAVDPQLKAEYARMRDDTSFVSQVRESLGDLLPAEMRPSDVRKLIAFDIDGDGMLSADELAAARKVIGALRRSDDASALMRALRTGQLFKNPVLTSVKQLFAPLEPSPFRFERTPRADGEEEGSVIDTVGAVSHVLKSHVPPGLRERRFSAAGYKAGFEVAAIDSMKGLGEMCIADSKVYVRETDDSRPDFFETRSSDSFLSTAALLVPNSAVPDMRVRFLAKEAPQGLPFVRLVNDLCVEAQSPFVFFGEVDWHKCDVTSISRAPTDGLTVHDHIADFYWKPGTVFHSNRTFLCGAVARDEEPRGPLCAQIFDKIFYSDLSRAGSKAKAADARAPADGAARAEPTKPGEHHFSEKVSSLVGPSKKHVYCHAHLITYNAAGKLVDVWHLNPNSVVADMDLQVYKIRALNAIDA